MANVALEATLRDQTGKGIARRLRVDGRIPAVMYGVDAPVSLSLSRREVERLLASEGGDGLIDLKIDTVGKKGVIVRDLQTHPVTGILLHCDLYEVQKGHRITVTVAIHLIGDTPKGVREQGILQHQTHELEVDCLPNEIPAAIEVDASDLAIGDAIHVSELNIPDGVRVHTAEETVVVTVSAPRVADETVSEDAEEEGAEETTTDADEE